MAKAPLAVQLLGAVEVCADERHLDIGPARQRAVLAALAVDAGRPVSVAVLVDRVWGERPPQRAKHNVYVYVARLRDVLAAAAPGTLVRRSGGYVLDVEPDAVDLLRFGRLAARAGADSPALLREALALWRGTPLSGIEGDWADDVRDRASRERLDTAIRWADAQTPAGEPDAVANVLADLLVAHPLVEPLAAAHMRALHAAGRGAEALDCYARMRQLLADELGTEPGSELRALHERLLRGGGQGTAGPAQLPLDVADFAGRANHLADLDALTGADKVARAVVISAVSGTAGVGKTTLAVHWGHRVADRFPDGQLYVNLRGYDAGGAVMPPGDALRGFLTALEVPAPKIPADLAGRAALYRSELARRRVLVVLDNARDAEQVRPLLPGSRGSVVVVTSRSQLTGLVATEGAQLLNLDLLTFDESRQLLAARLGEQRVAAEPAAVERIIDACSRLPLALAIAAARALARPDRTLTALAAELAAARLDALDAGDPAADARTVFSWSYQALTAAAARMFRLLGLHPGPDFDGAAAASLGGVPLAVAATLLEELSLAQLIARRGADRYGFHDLLRAYAHELTCADDPDAVRTDAHARLHDHYVHHAQQAATHLTAHKHRHDNLLTPRDGVCARTLTGPDEARAWFAAEREPLLAAVSDASAQGLDAHAWQLAYAVATFLDRTSAWTDSARITALGLAAAERLGDETAVALLAEERGRALARLGDVAEGRGLMERVVALHRRNGNRRGEAGAQLNLSWMSTLLGEYPVALDHVLSALAGFTELDDDVGRATTLNAVAYCHGKLGDFAQTVEYGERAVDLSRAIGYARFESGALDTVGVAYQQLGDHRRAIERCSRAVEILERLGDRYTAAQCLLNVAASEVALGDVPAARAAYERSLAVLDDLGHAEADAVRQKLAALPS